MSTATTSQPDDYYDRFGGLARLYGRDALERLRRAHACVVGVGGVGSWTAEALARSGVGAITLIDLDDVCVTNVNRQLPALDGQIGRPKVAALADRIRLINPACRVTPVTEFFTSANASELLGPELQKDGAGGGGGGGGGVSRFSSMPSTMYPTKHCSLRRVCGAVSHVSLQEGRAANAMSPGCAMAILVNRVAMICSSKCAKRCAASTGLRPGNAFGLECVACGRTKNRCFPGPTALVARRWSRGAGCGLIARVVLARRFG